MEVGEKFLACLIAFFLMFLIYKIFLPTTQLILRQIGHDIQACFWSITQALAALLYEPVFQVHRLLLAVRRRNDPPELEEDAILLEEIANPIATPPPAYFLVCLPDLGLRTILTRLLRTAVIDSDLAAKMVVPKAQGLRRTLRRQHHQPAAVNRVR